MRNVLNDPLSCPPPSCRTAPRPPPYPPPDPVDRSRVDFLYYDGSPPTYDYEYYNDYNDVSKVRRTVNSMEQGSMGCGVAHYGGASIISGGA
jgi:hypothetical protein